MEIITTMIQLSKFLSADVNEPDDKKQKWAFRGSVEEYPLETSLDRACQRFGVPDCNARNFEKRLTREFERRANQYEPGVHLKTNLGIISLMQHYGAPTRLLDWTWSKYVALYFAFRQAKERKQSPVMWEINTRTLQDAAWKKVESLKSRPNDCDLKAFLLHSPDERQKDEVFNFLLDDVTSPFVFPVTPYHFNDRMAIQKGVFLCPTAIDCTFQECLDAVSTGILRTTTFQDLDPQVVLAYLDKMNISECTLFPGLQGFASSLSLYYHGARKFRNQRA